MADLTSAAVTIHACPPHSVRQVVDTLEEYSLRFEDTTAARRTVEVGESCTTDEFVVGHAKELARDLMACAPDVAFTVHEEPKYEWLGETCSYVPDLGLFTAECDNGGNPMFTQSEVLRLDDQPADVRKTKLGVPWLTAIAAMPHGTVAEPDSFATHWSRRTSEVIVVDGKQCGADLIFATSGDVAPVDAALTERGFLRTNDWVPLDEALQIWRTDVYRSPSH